MREINRTYGTNGTDEIHAMRAVFGHSGTAAGGRRRALRTQMPFSGSSGADYHRAERMSRNARDARDPRDAVLEKPGFSIGIWVKNKFTFFTFES